MNSGQQELLGLTQQLLNSITDGDWVTYCKLCDSSLTAFEPEARGHLVEGMDFHQFYFQATDRPRRQTTISSPHVRLCGGDAAVICYTRLIQREDEAGQWTTQPFEETRIWERQNGEWQHVHFHRSANV